MYIYMCVCVCVCVCLCVMSFGSAVSVATGYGLETEGSKFESRENQEFSLLHIVQTGSGPTQPSVYRERRLFTLE
jgi:hypothetical protein